MPEPESSGVRSSDLAEMLVGGAALAYPVAIAEETWNLGAELSWLRILLLLTGSVIVLGWYGLHAFHGGALRGNWKPFLNRIAVVYLLTAVQASLLLLVVDKWPILADTSVALKRTIIVTFPAVFSATIVDNLR